MRPRFFWVLVNASELENHKCIGAGAFRFAFCPILSLIFQILGEYEKGENIFGKYWNILQKFY